MSIIHSNRPRVHGARSVGNTPGANALGNTSLTTDNGPRATDVRGDQQPTLARFIVDGPVPPHVTDTLPLAEAFRAAAMSQFERGCRREGNGAFRRRDRPARFASPVLAGKDADGLPGLGHDHAYYLPTAEARGGRLDHLTVYAAGGFGAAETAALAAIRTLRWAGGTLDVRLIGLGGPGDGRVPLLGPAGVWVSATPFVACRYPKRSGSKRDRPETYATACSFAAHVLREEIDRLDSRLRQRGDALPAVLRIDALDGCGSGQDVRPIQFQRARHKAGDDGSWRPCGAFRITFAAAVQGPIALGHSCHFGLGLFIPAPASEQTGDP